MTRTADPFVGEGEIRLLGRSLDWAATPLGAVERWSDTLRHVVRTCLDSPFPISLWCGPQLVLIYNDAYRAVLGAKHPRALGRPGHEVWAEIWGGVAPLFEQIRAGGPPVYDEDAPFFIRRSGGQEPSEAAEPNAWFTFSLSPVRDDAGEIVAFLNIVSESTGRVLAERAREAARARTQRAEARLRDIFAQAPTFLAVLRGPEHVFEYANDSYYALVGPRELLGRPLLEALPEIRGQGFEQLLDHVLETGEPYTGREVPVTVARAPDRPTEQRFVDFVYYPLTEADGTRSGVVAHGSDVTQHVLSRREAQRARAEAERANRAKSQFLATMSHEIRTPINAILGYADLLDAAISGPLTESQQQYVDGIRSSGRHLLGLISEVLDLSKIEAGELVVGLGEIDARAEAVAALEIVTPEARARRIELRDRLECGKDELVLGDADRIRQILLNLLSNALKFTDPGGTVTVGCRVAETAPADATLPGMGPWVVLEVEDTGRGISRDQLARIFEPFVQEETGHTRRVSGTGLGLTISRRLARLMGAELTVRSKPGVGSSFCLWLAPAVQERTPAPFPDAASHDVWPPEPRDLPGLAPAGHALLAHVGTIEAEWVDRLIADREIRAAERMNRAQVADQTAELIAAFAKTLIVLEEGGGDPALLSDAESIQEATARRHGYQRRRLGWSRGELELEYRLLGELLDAALRREAPKRTAASLSTAVAVVRRMVARATRISVAAFEGAVSLPGGSEPAAPPGRGVRR